MNALESLGSTRIRQICWRGSWAMVGVKGMGVPLAEDVQQTEEARAEAAVQTPEPPTTATDGYSTPDGTPLTVAPPGVLANDLANGGGAMTSLLTSGAADGVVSLDTNGGFVFTPNAGYAGADSFAYRASNIAGAGTIATVTIVVGTPQPQSPTNLRVQAIIGNTVTFGWTPATTGLAATGFRIEGGVAPGQVLGALDLDTTPAVAATLPPGSWYLRVGTVVNGSLSAPSNEVLAHLTPNVAPAAPTTLLGQAHGNTLHLAWRTTGDGATSVGGLPDAVILNVSGLVNGSFPIGLVSDFSYTPVPPGTYTFTVQASNETGTSAPSSPVSLTFPGVCTRAAGAGKGHGAQVWRTGTGVLGSACDWSRPDGYVPNVTGSVVGGLALTGRSFSASAPPGTYHLTLVSTNPCGSSTPTVARTVVVP